ncbi:hypothetical protein SS1G_00523 [Sclerotinia sclerotiorum 1980 UF-70]|uniref:Initiator tRNA phosphoribosyl transferase n=1 Tax=Sclerotinia sclerotiorum (strain ATCC 18683 / 1980 / Ss-1) TaxID=665079 RepID=A7E5E8_SCLS1|nr:hypothetical protein SS1G_00523 [Sclerotinia sclerotiorum 1980 UF-70]EDN91120.1 hypothetical protein SS1G_00523 [Sclerotinia sclerotiorum 1980 UF-70]
MPLTVADIVFNEQASHNFSKTLGEIKRATLSIHNRLRSILEDAEFAESVANAYNRPLMANERCGSWYINPNKKGGSAYFKSTDGHTGVWKFSSRRLNLHLLEIIGDNDGNPTAHKLYAPPQVVSDSEHAQITNLLPQFVQAFQALNLPIETFRSKLRKPIRPIWVTPESQVSNTGDVFEDFHPVICCTVSRRVAGGEVSEGGYIQGAGDDTENWAHGLTPNIFWTNQQQLLETSEEDLPELIETLINHSSSSLLGSNNKLRLVKPTSCLSISTIDTVSSLENNTSTCIIVLLPKITHKDTWYTSPSRMDIGLGSKKVGSKNLRAALKDITSFIIPNLKKLENSQESSTPHQQIIIACESGQDLSIGVALALLCLYFNDDGVLEEVIVDFHFDAGC